MIRAQKTFFLGLALATFSMAGVAFANDDQPQQPTQQPSQMNTPPSSAQPPSQMNTPPSSAQRPSQMNQPSQPQQPSQMNQPSSAQQPSQMNQPSQGGQAMPSTMTAEKMSASATIEKIDTKKRELSLRDDEGNRFMVQVPEDVTTFDKLKKGDKIDLDYYQSVALSLKKPMKGEAPSAGEEVATGSAPNLPGGMVARRITATATVQKVDVAANKVTIKAPNGKMDTINVSDPGLQSQLSNLKKGDRIKASYTEAMAITVSPKNKE